MGPLVDRGRRHDRDRRDGHERGVHAASPFELSIVRRPGTIRAVVRDTSQALPELRPPSVDRPGGRGMILVDAFSSAWGVDPEPAGKAVWAEFVIVEDRDA